MTDIVVERVTDLSRFENALEDLARLRISVFRGWPHLYSGSLVYERRYLAHFARSPSTAIFVARDGDFVVGAATASPMIDQDEAIRTPIERVGEDVRSQFYFGESILLDAYRGRGLGHRFFDLREQAAREYGADTCYFCSVLRPDEHPLRPAQPRDLSLFWRRRGYEPLEGRFSKLSWQDLDKPEETDHLLQFWRRRL